MELCKLTSGPTVDGPERKDEHDAAHGAQLLEEGPRLPLSRARNRASAASCLLDMNGGQGGLITVSTNPPAS